MLRLEFSVKNDETQVHHKNQIMAVVNSGSQTNLIKNKYIPLNARLSMSHHNHGFCGVNHSHIQIQGIFKSLVEIEDIEAEIKFAVVPNEIMAHATLLGRDFMSRPEINKLLIKALRL